MHIYIETLLSKNEFYECKFIEIEKRLGDRFLQVSNYVMARNQTVQHKFLIFSIDCWGLLFYFLLPSSPSSASPHSAILYLSHQTITIPSIYTKKVKHKIWVNLIHFFFLLLRSVNETLTRKRIRKKSPENEILKAILVAAGSFLLRSEFSVLVPTTRSLVGNEKKFRK